MALYPPDRTRRANYVVTRTTESGILEMVNAEWLPGMTLWVMLNRWRSPAWLAENGWTIMEEGFIKE